MISLIAKPRGRGKLEVMSPKLVSSLIALALLLSACGLFGGGSELGATCYPNAAELTAAATPTGASEPAYVPGQLLVRYEDGGAGSLQSLTARSRAVAREYGLRTLEPASQHADLVALPAGQSVEEALKALRADPRVAYAEPNYYLYAQATPNDIFLGEQWNLLDFGLPQAWAIETGQSGVTVAVLDSGVDLSHEDLRGKLVQGCDFYNKDNDANPGLPKTTLDQTHGTHVAGIAAATGDNGAGVAGVAYAGVKILPVKVFDDAGRVATSDVVAKAIRWAAGLSVSGVARNPNPARVINLSLGGSSRDPNTGEQGTIRILDDAIRDARRAGSLVVVASGNDSSPGGAKGNEIYAPANAPDALAVGSVDSDYRRSTFSMYSTSGPSVDLMAPGGLGPSECGLVVSTVAAESGGGNYGCQAGTSMAAPFVAGVAALLWSQNPDWSADQVEAQLLASTLSDASFMSQSEYGAGVLCADRALGAATLCGN